MLVLGIDTSLKHCSAAIISDGEPFASRRIALETGHAEHIAPLVAEILSEARLAIKNLDRVAVVIGPGAFAGVRVGLAFARGLAIGTRLDVAGVTSLAALAAGAGNAALAGAVIDARRGQVYAALYEKGSPRVAPFVASPPEALARLTHAAAGRDVVLAGDGASLLAPLSPTFAIAGADSAIDPVIVARMGAAAEKPGAPPSPLYLRAPDAKPGAPSPFAGIFEDPS